ncbi:MAG TPA: non-homologous end-joining DNA ligase [Acidimicrobiales bacterium]|nr:non-homologous end-joining DNA ligase [Acidimicrobiales bacterium]
MAKRRVRDPLRALSADSQSKLRRAKPPDAVAPMLATLTEQREFGDDWVFEHKFDGERCFGFIHHGQATLRSRSDRDVTSTYPELSAALERQAHLDAVVDGEVVAVRGGDVLGFQDLQQRLGQRAPSRQLVATVPIALCAFDVVFLDGHDVTGLRLVDRKALLREAVGFDDVVRYTTHEQGDSRRHFERACASGWEGLIAKEASSTYTAGRSRQWLKLKCIGEQELVVGGFTEPRGTRVGLGALLVGYYEDGKLRYAGKVGTGFDRATLEDLRARLTTLQRSTSPFAEAVRPLPPGTRWVRPQLVAQIGFGEWTRAGRLRQPRFLGLRDDKAPEDVVRESSQQ